MHAMMTARPRVSPRGSEHRPGAQASRRWASSSRRLLLWIRRILIQEQGGRRLLLGCCHCDDTLPAHPICRQPRPSDRHWSRHHVAPVRLQVASGAHSCARARPSPWHRTTLRPLVIGMAPRILARSGGPPVASGLSARSRYPSRSRSSILHLYQEARLRTSLRRHQRQQQPRPAHCGLPSWPSRLWSQGRRLGLIMMAVWTTVVTVCFGR